MGKPSAPTPPPAPDPADAIRAQAETNRIDQHTPLGSVTFSGPNNRVSTLSLTPEVQALLDRQIGITGNVLDQAENLQQFIPQTGVDFSGFSQIPTLDQFDEQGAQLEKATFDRGLNLLDESFGRREDQLRARLANQGLPVGSEAFNDEFNLAIADPRREAENALMLESIGAGRQEQSRLFNQATSTRQQQIAEALTQRQVPFNELASILGLQQTQAPTNFSGFIPPTPVDVNGANAVAQNAFGNQLGVFNAQNQQNASLLGGLTSLGSAAIYGGLF